MRRSWQVPSQEELGKYYTVELSDEGFSCSCPDYRFRKRRLGQECKHIYAVKVSQGILGIKYGQKVTEGGVDSIDLERVAEPAYVEHPMVRSGAIEDRRYQRELVDEAIGGNTLIVLPTALGKTVIAELVAAELLSRHPGCRILVMAPTKPLVAQHRESFLRHLRIEPRDAVMVTGETRAREVVWRSGASCVFATPQTVWNDLSKGLVMLEEFALLVFDECHRSRSRYAYTRLASEYARRCPWPRILALTASPGSEEEKVYEIARNLLIEKIAWRTEDDEEISCYIPGVKVSWIRVRLPNEYEAIRNHVKSMIESMAKQLQGCGELKVPLENINRKVIVQAMSRLRAEIDSGVRGRNMHYMVLCSEILSVYHALELIESQHVYSLRKYLEEVVRSELRSHRMLAKRPEFQQLVRMVEGCGVDHPKIEILATLVEQHLRDRPGERIMVFANIRHTAEVIVGRLAEKGIAARMFIGRGEGKAGPRMTQEEQVKLLREFKEGSFGVLVATSIGEEGLDVPECGLVIFYEPAVSGIRYIQRRGRTGRRLPGKVIILIAEGTVDEYYFREGYRRARKMDDALRRVSAKIAGFRVERRGPEPRIGEPWPWRRGRDIEITIEGPEKATALSEGEREKEDIIVIQPEDGGEDYEGRPNQISFSEIHHCSRHLYTLLLRAGAKGACMAEFLESLEYDPDVIRAAASRLIKRGVIVRSGDRYYARSVLRGLRSLQGEIYRIEVEKIYPGFAVVLVNDRFRARLESSMYYGPREYIKKGNVMMVRGTITKSGGATSIIIHDVISLE